MQNEVIVEGLCEHCLVDVKHLHSFGFNVFLIKDQTDMGLEQLGGDS